MSYVPSLKKVYLEQVYPELMKSLSAAPKPADEAPQA